MRIKEIVVSGGVKSFTLGLKHSNHEKQYTQDIEYEFIDAEIPLRFETMKLIQALQIILEEPSVGQEYFPSVTIQIFGCFNRGKYM